MAHCWQVSLSTRVLQNAHAHSKHFPPQVLLSAVWQLRTQKVFGPDLTYLHQNQGLDFVWRVAALNLTWSPENHGWWGEFYVLRLQQFTFSSETNNPRTEIWQIELCRNLNSYKRAIMSHDFLKTVWDNDIICLRTKNKNSLKVIDTITHFRNRVPGYNYPGIGLVASSSCDVECYNSDHAASDMESCSCFGRHLRNVYCSLVGLNLNWKIEPICPWPMIDWPPPITPSVYHYTESLYVCSHD